MQINLIFLDIYSGVQAQLTQWKGITLSIPGRICLVNSVILSKMVYSFIVYRWPLTLLKGIITQKE